MSVNHVNNVGRVVLPTAAARTSDPATSSRPSEDPAAASTNETAQQPTPPRFPWLSRLARELEPASKQPSPYGTVPILGEKLDKQA